MKKIFSILLAVVLAAALLAGCQPTPSEVVVGNKGEDTLESAIAASAVPESTPVQTDEADGITSMIVSEHWTDSETSKLTTINIDAKVLMPNVTAYPVLQVAPVEINETVINNCIAVLAEGAVKVYNNVGLTKEECSGEIVRLQKDVQDLKNGKLPPDDKRSANVQIEELEQQLKYYENLYTKLQQTEDQSSLPLDYTFNPTFGDDSVSILLINAEMKDESLCSFQFNKSDYSGVKGSSVTFSRETGGKSISTEDATQKAKDTIQSLGIGNFNLVFKENRGNSVWLHFSKSLDGIPLQCRWTSNGASGGVTSEPEYVHPIGQESITIGVDDAGVNYLSWDEPCNVVRAINENVQLLSLEKIKDTFKKQILFNIYEADGKENNISITNVELRYMIIPEKNDLLNYRTIPVWDFIGIDNGGTDITDQSGIEASERIYLTVNAVNGTIINRNLGY